MHRVREGDKVEHLACGNRLRGLLAEFGVVIAQSDAALARTDARCWRLQAMTRVGPLTADALVAIANKHTRQAWAMLANNADYDPHAWLTHPMLQRPPNKRRAAH